jgi:hypothetical protein
LVCKDTHFTNIGEMGVVKNYSIMAAAVKRVPVSRFE